MAGKIVRHIRSGTTAKQQDTIAYSFTFDHSLNQVCVLCFWTEVARPEFEPSLHELSRKRSRNDVFDEREDLLPGIPLL